MISVFCISEKLEEILDMLSERDGRCWNQIELGVKIITNDKNTACILHIAEEKIS